MVVPPSKKLPATRINVVHQNCLLTRLRLIYRHMTSFLGAILPGGERSAQSVIDAKANHFSSVSSNIVELSVALPVGQRQQP